MKKRFLNTGTITKASRGRDILRRNGIAAYVQAARGSLSSSGCGYGIIIGSSTLERAIRLLKTAGIEISGIVALD